METWLDAIAVLSSHLRYYCSNLWAKRECLLYLLTLTEIFIELWFYPESEQNGLLKCQFWRKIMSYLGLVLATFNIIWYSWHEWHWYKRHFPAPSGKLCTYFCSSFGCSLLKGKCKNLLNQVQMFQSLIWLTKASSYCFQESQVNVWLWDSNLVFKQFVS